MVSPTNDSSIDRRHIVRAYDRELTQLRALVVDMGEAVIEQTRRAVRALTQLDGALARQVIDAKPRIDALSLAADEEIFTVIAKRQPTAVDLRVVLAVSKVAGDLERAGDKAARIARNVLRLVEDGALDAGGLPSSLQPPLRRIDDLVCCMLERAVDAMTRPDLDKATGVFQDAETLQGAYTELSDALLAEQTTLGGVRLARLLGIAHALERIGNHAAGIAEQVVYVITGQDVRHRNRELLVDALRSREPR